MKKEPILSFEFANSVGEVKPLTFRNPIKLIVAYSINDVLPCFEQIEKAIEAGYYVAGYLSYESAPAFDDAYKVKKNSTMPLLWFGVFTEPVEEMLSGAGEYHLSEWIPSVTTDEYRGAIQSIKESIENGHTYQTNYTIRLRSMFQGDDLSFFEQLRKAQSSNYCAYINTGDYRILSASPELFFHLKDGKLTTRPMKGTIKRGKTVQEDEERRNELFHSEKNRAENLMIVDLLRNDLSVVAKPGSVQVEKLFEIENYPTVHQMTSTITAALKENTGLLEIFKALFPCGSITGAPKISTMDIIEQLETAPREVYCGAIGYITPTKEAIFNVPIRTVLINEETSQATYGVGGGITWDSTTEDEYYEILAKASLLQVQRPEFQLLESLLLVDGEFFILEEHLERLSNSAKYFGYAIDIEMVKIQLLQIAERNKQGEFKVRCVIDKKEELQIDVQSLTTPNQPFYITMADQPIDKNNLFLYHKTTNREVYSQFQRKFPEVFDVLLWNEDGEITEFTNGNIVLEIDNELWTPPISSGLLAGTFRERLMKAGRIHEKVLTVADLNQSSAIWFINSVRKWVKVQLKE
ncbi:aminodeoxychorismate synthase component I [Lysinibacillus sp. BW-2-10]|uniref:aminodeoxychorismate synthase component I n=1 Tax=Lysinibacillus sp. BW-2-10 TaxID=2590030 RepID=UPI00117FE191|nr:aminodeoxychorismate synthase component I [Lysinibacillus sp. BW-2-10]TSI03894.1 aminodeoxychorismate synthase component I [Lysinibacillus sp. BW-2-10]